MAGSAGTRAPGMRIRPRDRVLQRAHRELGAFIMKIWAEYDLSDAEMMSLLASEVNAVAASMLRVERDRPVNG